jgi:hypothetical protein
MDYFWATKNHLVSFSPVKNWPNVLFREKISVLSKGQGPASGGTFSSTTIEIIKLKGCVILLRKIIDNLFRYFKLDRLSIPIINILEATDYHPIW